MTLGSISDLWGRELVRVGWETAPFVEPTFRTVVRPLAPDLVLACSALKHAYQ